MSFFMLLEPKPMLALLVFTKHFFVGCAANKTMKNCEIL